jgi:PAS domain S-box-containing protein
MWRVQAADVIGMSSIRVGPRSTAADPGSVGERVGAGPADPLAELVDVARTPTLQAALRAIREMLGMDVAYVSEIVGDDMVLRELDGDGASFRLAAGGSLPRRYTYCQRMLDGRIPNLIPDVLADDRTASLPITMAGNVRAFSTVPLTFADERLYGTLCAASHHVKSFEYRELQFLKLVARLIADQLERETAGLELSKLASLVNAADDAIMGLTPAGVVTSWNHASERIFGYPAGNAIGHSIIELIARPGDEDEMREAFASVCAGEVVHREGPRRRADGAMISDAVTLSPIYGERGEVSFISAVCRDVSAAVSQAHIRRVEQEVLSALETAGDADEAAMAMLGGVGRGVNCEIAALWELDESQQKLRCSALWVSDRSADTPFALNVREEQFARGEELPGRIWASGQSVWVGRLGSPDCSPRVAAATAAGLRTAVGHPLIVGGKVVGVAEFFTRRETAENPELLALGLALVGRLSDALGRHRAQEALRDVNQALEFRVRERTADLQRAVADLDASQIETVRRLSRAVEFRDEDTGAHIARISALAARTARSAGLDAEHCDLIERASPLHDLGKVAIPDSVLLKPGPLTPAERLTIETHAEIGHRLLDGSDSPVLQLAATIALTHHERYDGSGYPHGLTGETIPIEGRIVAIADVFDALTSDRVYRPAMTLEQAVAVLQDGRNTHFDPVLLDHFLNDLHHPGVEPHPTAGQLADAISQSTSPASPSAMGSRWSG